jgi:hypothetical protein
VNEKYRERAEYFQQVIAQTQGLDIAADVIEKAFAESRFADQAGKHAVSSLT